MDLNVEPGKLYWNESANLVRTCLEDRKPAGYDAMMAEPLGSGAIYRVNRRTGRAMLNDHDGGRALDLIVKASLQKPLKIGNVYATGTGRIVTLEKAGPNFQGMGVYHWGEGAAKGYCHVDLATGLVTAGQVNAMDLVADAPTSGMPAVTDLPWYALKGATLYVPGEPIPAVRSVPAAELLSDEVERLADEADARSLSPHRGSTLADALDKPSHGRGHPYAAEMLQYAEDAQDSAEPWHNWEWRFPANSEQMASHWEPCNTHPGWTPPQEYRRKPAVPMETLGIQEYPRPMLELPDDPKTWSYYYYPAVGASANGQTVFSTAEMSEAQVRRLLCRGLLHDNPQAAGWHAKALMTLTTKMWKDAQ